MFPTAKMSLLFSPTVTELSCRSALKDTLLDLKQIKSKALSQPF